MLLHDLSGGPIEPDVTMVLDIKFDMALQLSDDDEEKPLRLKRVGDLFYGLHNKYHKNADLDKAIAAYEAAARLTPDGHQYQAELHSQLGLSLLERFEYFGNVADIDSAIFALEGSLILTPEGHRAISANEQAVNILRWPR